MPGRLVTVFEQGSASLRIPCGHAHSGTFFRPHTSLSNSLQFRAHFVFFWDSTKHQCIITMYGIPALCLWPQVMPNVSSVQSAFHSYCVWPAVLTAQNAYLRSWLAVSEPGSLARKNAGRWRALQTDAVTERRPMENLTDAPLQTLLDMETFGAYIAQAASNQNRDRKRSFVTLLRGYHLITIILI